MKNGETELSIEASGDLERALMERLRSSGLRDEACERCTRPFLTRHPATRLCVPCRRGAPDGWSPGHTMRKIVLGDARIFEDQTRCSGCGGLGVPGWVPGAECVPCERCVGLGIEHPVGDPVVDPGVDDEARRSG